ncbi:MAG: hypothetical protein ACRDGV_13350, partial [Candidatus Limnocylindria bacterium]
GFHERARTDAGPLAAPPGPIPLASSWPPLAGLAVVMAGLGLIYGPWLLLPGLALGVVAAYGWLVQLD